jgi:hypothetical protein
MVVESDTVIVRVQPSAVSSDRLEPLIAAMGSYGTLERTTGPETTADAIREGVAT